MYSSPNIDVQDHPAVLYLPGKSGRPQGDSEGSLQQQLTSVQSLPDSGLNPGTLI